MTTTTRRTTRLSKSSANQRGYVAIKCEFIAAETDTLACVANEAMHITGVNGAFIDLAKGEEFYLVRAASLGPDMFYIVRLVAGMKKCSCAANKPCRHERLVAPLVVARTRKVCCVTLRRKKHADDVAALELIASAPKPTPDLGERGNLNGQRGFSILR